MTFLFKSSLSLIIVKPYSPDVKPLSIFLVGDNVENPTVVDKPKQSIEAADEETQLINENIKGLKGREYQALLRIVREYNKGKLSRLQAAHMLMSGYGLTEEQCNAWLGEEETDNL